MKTHGAELREHLKQCNVVHVYYPDLYLKLVESDMNDNTFRKKIKQLYQQAVGGASARRSLINSGERADGLRRQGANPWPTTIPVLTRKRKP